MFISLRAPSHEYISPSQHRPLHCAAGRPQSVAGLFYGSDTVVSHEKAATAGIRCRQHVCCCSDDMTDALVRTAVVLHNDRPTDSARVQVYI